MRVWLAVLFIVSVARAAVPTELAEAIKTFRSDPPPGWSYTLTTAGEGKSTVEHCDAAKPEFERWSLLMKDGRPPTPDESREYFEGRSRRSRGGTGPKIIEQLDLGTLQPLSATGEQVSYTCRVKPGGFDDNVSPFLRAKIVLHQPTRSILSITLTSTGEFSPSWFMKIAEMSTRLTYSLPDSNQPSLPQTVETHLRGRAFWFKSIDGDLTVTFSDYEKIGRK